jgi:hypothetical protein
MSPHKIAHRTPTQIFAVPLLVAVVSIVGLASALVGDGWWDAVSWATLGVPILLYLIFIYRRRPN